MHQQAFGQVRAAVACLQFRNDATLPLDTPRALGHARLSLCQSFLQVCPRHRKVTPVRCRRFAFRCDHAWRLRQTSPPISTRPDRRHTPYVESRLSLQRQRFAGVDLPRQFAIAGGQLDVNTQVTQPTTWASLESRRDPREHLQQRSRGAWLQRRSPIRSSMASCVGACSSAAGEKAATPASSRSSLSDIGGPAWLMLTMRGLTARLGFGVRAMAGGFR